MSAERCRGTHHKMRGKTGKKKTQGSVRTLSQFLCEEIRLYRLFCVCRCGAVLRFYCYQYRDHSASQSR